MQLGDGGEGVVQVGRALVEPQLEGTDEEGGDQKGANTQKKQEEFVYEGAEASPAPAGR